MDQFPGSLLDIEYYLPETIVTNNFFRENYPEWKVDQTQKKTGVLERRVARADETAYDLALMAVKQLLNNHPSLVDKIDAIIFCTQTPDYIMPSNAFLLQKDLGLNKTTMAFDYNLACSGYIYGLAMASSFTRTGLTKNVLLVTADTYSKYLDENDRATRLLFGDAASASWIGSSDNCGFMPMISAFKDFHFGTDGSGWNKFIIKSGGNRQPASLGHEAGYSDKIYMNGIQIVNFVNHLVVKQMFELLSKHGMSVENIDQFFIHQASGMALECIASKLKIDRKKMFSNMEIIGNTVSSSLPILIKDYFSHTEIKKGSRLFLSGFGVGFSWGSMLATK